MRFVNKFNNIKIKQIMNLNLKKKKTTRIAVYFWISRYLLVLGLHGSWILGRDVNNSQFQPN